MISKQDKERNFDYETEACAFNTTEGWIWHWKNRLRWLQTIHSCYVIQILYLNILRNHKSSS